MDEDLKDALLTALDDISGSITVMGKGHVISDRIDVNISRRMLENEPLGLKVCDVVTVKLDDDIPAELIQARLTISDCVDIHCSREQEDAVNTVSSDIVEIVTGEGSDALKKAEEPGTQMINSAHYVM